MDKVQKPINSTYFYDFMFPLQPINISLNKARIVSSYVLRMVEHASFTYILKHQINPEQNGQSFYTRYLMRG
jgi:hypothetical protein